MSFDPFSQLDRFAASVLDSARTPRMMPVDLYRVEDHYVLDANLPGVDPESIDIDVDGQVLTIRAERNASSVDGAKWLAQERPYGSYVRQFSLGDGVDLDKISASYENGVLSITIPVSEKTKPRKIRIGSQPAKKKRLLGV
jgi:HSP20 family protein